MRERQIKQLQTNLLKARGFAYLRYLHLYEFVAANAAEIKTVGICGAGRGISELAIALEFPNIEFLLTDVVYEGNPRRPNYFWVMELVTRWQVPNVRFGIWDLLKPPPGRFDVVASSEVLEHIEHASLALHNKAKAARRLVYALTPFATAQQNSDPEKRKAVFAQHEHYVCGYDADFFKSAGICRLVSGTYWKSHGVAFRTKLSQLSDTDIDGRFDELISEAKGDLALNDPASRPCMGIKAIIETAGF